MQRGEFPGPDGFFESLDVLFPILYEAYEHAVEQARQYFTERHRPINASLFPCIVRDEFAFYLVRQGHITQFEVHILANNGIRIRYRSCVLRFRMAMDGQLPPPGRSRTMQSFYRQMSWLPQVVNPAQTLRQLELPFSASRARIQSRSTLERGLQVHLSGLALGSPQGWR